MKRLQVVFDNNNDIIYELHDTRLTTAWYTMLEAYLNCSMFKIQDDFERFDFTELSDVINDLINTTFALVDTVHQLDIDVPSDIYDIVTKSHKFTITDLHILHEWYEKIRPGLDVKDETLDLEQRSFFYKHMHLMNDYIHQGEMFFKNGIMKRTIGPRPRLKVRYVDVVSNVSAPLKAPYHPEDRGNFVPKRSGGLYVAYAQVGKAPLSVYTDKDLHTSPVDWIEFGPAFYATFYGHDDTRNYNDARLWLTNTFGDRDWLLGEPEIGQIAGLSPTEAIDVIGASRKILSMQIV